MASQFFPLEQSTTEQSTTEQSTSDDEFIPGPGDEKEDDDDDGDKNDPFEDFDQAEDAPA